MDITYFLIIVTILIALFFIFRGINIWYWKINDRIELHKKTNVLLEKITIQLGAESSDEVTIEEISTGERRTMKIDLWLEFKENSTNYKLVK